MIFQECLAMFLARERARCASQFSLAGAETAMPTRDNRTGRSEKRWHKQTAAPGERLAGKLDDGVNTRRRAWRVFCNFRLWLGAETRAKRPHLARALSFSLSLSLSLCLSPCISISQRVMRIMQRIISRICALLRSD